MMTTNPIARKFRMRDGKICEIGHFFGTEAIRLLSEAVRPFGGVTASKLAAAVAGVMFFCTTLNFYF